MRYKAIIEYDGTPFYGWQRQVGFTTVQERLELALLPLSRELTCVHGAGRTDTGVHALEQTAHFDLDRDLDPFAIQQCMNHYLQDVPVSVLSVSRMDNNFHARFSAKQREYKYIIINRRSKPALLLNRAWWVIRSLDIDAMADAASVLVGTHDFSSFQAQGCQAKSPIRTVSKAEIIKHDDMIEFYIAADGFLYHQVRNIVGSLYNIGIGKWTKDDVIEVINKKDRSQAGMTVPACGLYFVKVSY